MKHVNLKGITDAEDVINFSFENRGQLKEALLSIGQYSGVIENKGLDTFIEELSKIIWASLDKTYQRGINKGLSMV